MSPEHRRQLRAGLERTGLPFLHVGVTGFTMTIITVTCATASDGDRWLDLLRTAFPAGRAVMQGYPSRWPALEKRVTVQMIVDKAS